MKLATYRHQGQDRVGLVEVERRLILDLAAADAAAGGQDAALLSMQALIDGGPAALDRVRQLAGAGGDGFRHQLDEVRLLPPLPVPQQIRDFTTFPLHTVQAPMGMARLAARMAGTEVPDPPRGEVPQVYRDRPIYYISNRFGVIGHEDEVVWPRYSDWMDFELEFAAVIGRGGVDIARSNAMAHVFGYTIFNDFSARDMQMHEMAGRLGPAKGKSFATGNAMGPWIVTADEIPDPRALTMEARVNGEVWASGDASEMLHGVDDMIAYVSQDEPLVAGEVFGSGTMGGGCGLELDRYLADGDVVELEVGGIGILRNRVRRQEATAA